MNVCRCELLYNLACSNLVIESPQFVTKFDMLLFCSRVSCMLISRTLIFQYIYRIVLLYIEVACK